MATCHPIMLPEGQKDLTRRAVLRVLSVSTAAVSAPMPVFSAVFGDDTQARPCAQHLVHPVLSLPFVRDTTAQEQAAGAPPRSFWQVKPTGDYGSDCATGALYAELALDYMVAANAPQVLQWTVFDMMTIGRRHSGIEVGFMSAFGRIATQGRARTTLGEGAVA